MENITEGHNWSNAVIDWEVPTPTALSAIQPLHLGLGEKYQKGRQKESTEYLLADSVPEA